MTDEVNGTQTEEAAVIPATDNAADTGSEQVTDVAKAEETPTEAEGEHAKRAPWFQKRIDELTREKWEARREAQAATALADALRNRKPEDGSQPAETPTDIDALVNRRAAEMREVEAFNEACNTTYQKGKEVLPDFDEAVKGYQLLGGLDGRREFLEAVNSLPNGSQIFYHLGKNLDEGAHVLALSPVKMALELTKLSQKLSKAPPVSNAPAPIKPLGGTAVHSDDPEKMSMKEWVAWREKQLAK
ncbi:hypothetical protein [Rhodanobacter glycinis]|uniref:hypothetical protein n=1 Tax=Rhodanobacter glycinis TaxID=582702 RepID=UPI0011280670|nr:hypothetical protein [Rhodanobacter glycinis]